MYNLDTYSKRALVKEILRLRGVIKTKLSDLSTMQTKHANRIANHESKIKAQENKLGYLSSLLKEMKFQPSKVRDSQYLVWYFDEWCLANWRGDYWYITRTAEGCACSVEESKVGFWWELPSRPNVDPCYDIISES